MVEFGTACTPRRIECFATIDLSKSACLCQSHKFRFRTQDDFFGVEDAIFNNRDREALRMMQRGKYVMVENDSSIVVIESAGYLSKVKVLKTGRVGWLKTSWIVD
jgi:hypothetical protein